MTPILTAALPLVLERLFMGLSGALAVVTLYKALMATLNSRGLMSSEGGAAVEPERIAMVIASIAAAAAYAYQCLDALPLTVNMLPPPPDWSLWLCAGGQLSYLFGKALRLQLEKNP